MNRIKALFSKLAQGKQITQKQLQIEQNASFGGIGRQKIPGIVFVAVGYLLSPLCWWNDLVFNLPLAYGFGYICSLFRQDLLIPASFVGYWLSNIAGILLIQVGTFNVMEQQPKERHLKKELLSGLVSSTVYTVIIVLLLHFHILDTPELGASMVNLSSLNKQGVNH